MARGVTTRAPYGSAVKTPCDACGKAISRTNLSKHKKKSKGTKERLSRSEIRKKSWEKNRSKRVGAQRAKRAARAFERLEELRAELLELESVSLPPKPEPVGSKGHELEDLSRDADLFEYTFTQTTFKAKIDRWLADCEDARHENNLLKAPIQDQIDAFGEGKNCKSLTEFEASYLARFAE
ncbi:hypothetical protein ON010_g15454 [Phytophthora cinnamomi]|nr:hypothetical protein ON010_g15454 [Phytophthora cinnamomi]